MSNFKIKKLPKEENASENLHEKNQKIKKNMRIFVLCLLGIFFSFFIFSIVAKSIGGIRVSSGTGTFIPIHIPNRPEVTQMEGQTNILIAGIGGAGHEGSLLTDSLMLAQIDNTTKRITLLSIPRDLFVAYPGGKSGGRINTLYGMNNDKTKGINLLAVKISEITGQPIHHYMVIDFTGFKYIVNALNGIDIDVPRDVVDREYPDNNWGYTTFIVRRGVQVFDGETALRYARSRHSTSDFDRSERQQLLIKAIKDKALSLDFLTSPGKIQNVLTAIRANIDTDLTLSHIIEYGLLFREMADNAVNVYGLGNSCSGLICSAGSYLYNPAREYFDGASVLIPENASANKLSHYIDTARFTEFIFRFPWIREKKIPLVIISSKSDGDYARTIAIALKKMGLNFDNENLFVISTGSIETSHINIYENSEINLGWKEDDPLIQAFHFLEEKIPFIFTNKNEYVTDKGIKIEIVLGKDHASYFTFAKPAYFLPYILSASGEAFSGGKSTSGEIKVGIPPQNIKNGIGKPIQNVPNEYSISPGEWENF